MGTTYRVLRQFYKYNTDQAMVAAAVGMHKQTLHKRLKAEGTKFSLLLRRWRTRMLRELLAAGKTVECMTNELCFQATGSFYVFFEDAMGISYARYKHERNAVSLAEHHRGQV